MELVLVIVITIGLMSIMLQGMSKLNQANSRLKSDLNTVVQRCENLTGLVKDMQEEIVKMESQQQLVEK